MTEFPEEIATESTENTIDLASMLQQPIDLDFELPDPQDENISEIEFEQRLDHAWLVCDRFDLQTDIWRGRILRSIRDREKKGGEGRGKGFLNWLKQREISKSQAYSLMELADSADKLLAEGFLDPDAIRSFSKRAFVETAKCSPEIQQIITEAANKGDRITRREVRQLTDEWTAMTSDLLPEEVREKASNGSLPPRYLAPLIKEMEKLPESHQSILQEEIADNPDIETVKQITASAKNLSRYLDAAAQVQVIRASGIDVESALEESVRVGCLNTAADLLKQAAQLEQLIAKLYTTWKRVGSLADRLYIDTGASTPNLRSLLTSMERLSGEVMEVQLAENDESTVRLRVLN
ncbi:MAG TPA: hypothetical protein V6C58_28065 [Allocoleopsis sp.]